MRPVTLLTALPVLVLGSPSDRQHSPDLSTASTPLPIDMWAKLLGMHGVRPHRVGEPRCDQALKDLANISGAELSHGMQDGLMDWWSEQTQNPLPVFPACLQMVISLMDANKARYILSGKHDHEYDDPALMHEMMRLGSLGVCKEVLEMTEASTFHGRGGAFHLISKFMAWLWLRPDRHEELMEACMVEKPSMLDVRHVRKSPCKKASRVLEKSVYAGLADKPWQHGVRKWWSKNHSRLLRLLHSDSQNDTDKEAHGMLEGEYGDIIGMNDPVVLLDKPHCTSVCKEIVRLAGDSGVHGQWGSFHFMLIARAWMVLNTSAVAKWEYACLHWGRV